GIMKTKSYREISSSPLWQTFLCHPDFARCFTLSEKKVWNCLSGDKKRTRGGKLRFIYVSSPGRPLIREVRVGDVVAEYRRQAGLPRGHM
ncbi:MAG: hypothetical protein N2578_04365, partial [Bdellovibrionaceae bacterium]|nr:hypothetical protein [Pseudobdellovibrionaceae bacterium]